MLQHRGNPFQPHARIDARLGERRERAVGAAVVLHKNEIPYLDIAVAIGVWRTGRPARNMRAVIVKNFRARPARPGFGHLPEVVGTVARAFMVAERKITEHLEKGMMPRGITDVFKIVMLAACAHTTLDAHRSRIRTGIAAGEHVFELHHAGIRKQQRWIVAWD